MPTLDHMLASNIRMLDYEKITNEDGSRCVAFGVINKFFFKKKNRFKFIFYFYIFLKYYNFYRFLLILK